MATDFPNSPAMEQPILLEEILIRITLQLGRGQVRREDQEVEHL